MGNTEKAQRTAVARQRSNIYGLLASVYRQEVNADLLHQVKDPQFLGVLSDLGIQLTSDFLQKPEEELLDDLEVEFAGLFLGPGGHISPHESVHHQRDGVESGMLWGEATAEVKKFIESAGLDYDPEYTGLPDHISVELEFMEALARHEEQAWSEDDDDTSVAGYLPSATR